jgi:riboflavin biosynthesis pyrimidine reductase
MGGALVDRLVLIVAPFLVGGDDTPGLLAAALPRPLKLEGPRVRKMGADTLFEADFVARG